MAVEALIVNTVARGPGQMLGLDDVGSGASAAVAPANLAMVVATGVVLAVALWWVFVTPPGKR